MTTKICSDCKLDLDISLFTKKSSSKDGLLNRCKNCESIFRKQYREKTKDQRKISRKRYYDKNIEKMREEKNKYTAKSKEKKQAYDLIYRKENKQKISKSKYEWEKKQLIADPTRKILKNLRRRLHHALNGNLKTESTLNLLGCTKEELKQHLELQFKDGMTWNNYGVKGWHIDHIIPCANFDLSDPEQQRQCFHYTNLRPLWEKDNVSKKFNIFHVSQKPRIISI
jgi:hypothetical protein